MLDTELSALEARIAQLSAAQTTPQLRVRVMEALHRTQRREQRAWLSSVAALLLAMLAFGVAPLDRAERKPLTQLDFGALGLSPAESKHWEFIAQRAELPAWAPLVAQEGGAR